MKDLEGQGLTFKGSSHLTSDISQHSVMQRAFQQKENRCIWTENIFVVVSQLSHQFLKYIDWI